MLRREILILTGVKIVKINWRKVVYFDYKLGKLMFLNLILLLSPSGI